jgi:hypothetical protein
MALFNFDPFSDPHRLMFDPNQMSKQRNTDCTAFAYELLI